MPSRPAIVGFLRGAGCPELKVVHCMDVADVALEIARAMATDGLNMDIVTVEAGALLHDIGIAFTLDDLSPEHCALGADFVRENGFTEAVARCVERHEMGGITQDEARELGDFPEPLRDTYLPEAIEERIVAFADLMYFTVAEEHRDPWEDPEAAAKALFGYADAVFRKKLGGPVPRDYAVLSRATALSRSMLPYINRSIFARWSKVVS